MQCVIFDVNLLEACIFVLPKIIVYIIVFREKLSITQVSNLYISNITWLKLTYSLTYEYNMLGFSGFTYQRDSNTIINDKIGILKIDIPVLDAFNWKAIEDLTTNNNNFIFVIYFLFIFGKMGLYLVWVGRSLMGHCGQG